MWVKGNKPELAPTKTPTAIDIAWAAGIFEGEGCCRLCGKTKRGFMAAVVQKDPEILYRLRDWFGGNVRGKDGEYECYTWDVCGDYGRIFMALIYEFMSARRKTQINASAALLFLGDKSSAGLTSVQLREELDAYYAENSRQQRKHQVEQQKKLYQKLRTNPDEVEKMRERSRLAREAMTPEQQEMSRKYQQSYYQRKKKQQQALKVLQFEKTA
jgi:hypothetical protein